MDERLRFVARLLDGEKMAVVCREFSLMDCDLGFFDYETCRLEPLADPLEPKLLPMSPV